MLVSLDIPANGGLFGEEALSGLVQQLLSLLQGSSLPGGFLSLGLGLLPPEAVLLPFLFGHQTLPPLRILFEESCPKVMLSIHQNGSLPRLLTLNHRNGLRSPCFPNQERDVLPSRLALSLKPLAVQKSPDGAVLAADKAPHGFLFAAEAGPLPFLDVGPESALQRHLGDDFLGSRLSLHLLFLHLLLLGSGEHLPQLHHRQGTVDHSQGRTGCGMKNPLLSLPNYDPSTLLGLQKLAYRPALLQKKKPSKVPSPLDSPGIAGLLRFAFQTTLPLPHSFNVDGPRKVLRQDLSLRLRLARNRSPHPFLLLHKGQELVPELPLHLLPLQPLPLQPPRKLF
eukprot:RCo003815